MDSVLKVLLVYYIIALHGDKNLIGTPLKRFVTDNRLAQHAIALMTIFVLFSLLTDLSIGSNMVYAAICYAWFVFSTKIDAHWNIMLILVLVSGFVADRQFRLNEAEAEADPNLNNTQKSIIINQNNNYRAMFVGSAALITIIGTVLYSERKAEQYGGSYDPVTYLFY